MQTKDKWSKTLVVDLDGTLCFHNRAGDTTEDRYGKAVPNKPVLDALHVAARQGYYIILHTSRRMWTHRGDVAAAEADVRDITENWLAVFDVPYDEIVFGKPFAAGGYYVDDKAMTPDGFVDFIANGIDMKAQVVLARDLAMKWHEFEKRRDGKTPYTNHLLEAVSLVSSNFEKAVLWLHDVLENTKCTPQDLLNAGVAP